MKYKEFIFGLDLSLTHCGLAIVNIESKKISTYASLTAPKDTDLNPIKFERFEHQRHMVDKIINQIPDGSHLAIEGYAFSMFEKVGHDSNFKEMMGLLFHSLLDKKCLFWTIPPAHTRTYVLGPTRIIKNLSTEEKLRRKKLKRDTKKLIVEYTEKENGKKIELSSSGKKNYGELVDYKTCLSKDRTYFEDIADAYVTVRYFLDTEYWENNPPQK